MGEVSAADVKKDPFWSRETIDELVKEYGTSPATVKRELSRLEPVLKQLGAVTKFDDGLGLVEVGPYFFAEVREARKRGVRGTDNVIKVAFVQLVNFFWTTHVHRGNLEGLEQRNAVLEKELKESREQLRQKEEKTDELIDDLARTKNELSGTERDLSRLRDAYRKANEALAEGITAIKTLVLKEA